MASYLSSLLTMQDSPQEEIESELGEGQKNVKRGKIEEEDKINEETEEIENETEEEENYEEEEEDDDYTDVEDDDDDDDGMEESRDEMTFKQKGHAEKPKETDRAVSGDKIGCSTGLQSRDVNSAGVQKVKVSCADGSSTWRKLLNELDALMKSLKRTNEISQLVQLLQSMHSIIRCAIEVIVLLENNCRSPPDETPFITTFFDDYFGDMIRLLVQVLATLSYENEEEEMGECVILMCLEMVGSLLHVPESRYALQQDIEAAVTLLSLPWHEQVPPEGNMNHSLSSLVTQLTALSSKFSNDATFINE